MQSLVILSFLTPFLFKIKYEIGNRGKLTFENVTKTKNVLNIINEIFDKKFQGQQIKAFQEAIIIKGKIKGEKGKTANKRRTYSDLASVSNPFEIEDYDEIFIRYPDPESNKSQFNHSKFFLVEVECTYGGGFNFTRSLRAGQSVEEIMEEVFLKVLKDEYRNWFEAQTYLVLKGMPKTKPGQLLNKAEKYELIPRNDWVTSGVEYKN